MAAEERYRELAEELARAAEAIRSETPLSFSQLLGAIDAVRAEWAASCDGVAKAGIPTLSADQFDPPSLRTALVEIERRRRIAALVARISRALDIAHRTDENFEPLTDLAARVREGAAAIEAEEDPVPILAPFESLENLIEHGSHLPDEKADELHAEVASAFGSKLALAAVRGRLYFRNPPPPSDGGHDGPVSPPPVDGGAAHSPSRSYDAPASGSYGTRDTSPGGATAELDDEPPVARHHEEEAAEAHSGELELTEMEAVEPEADEAEAAAPEPEPEPEPAPAAAAIAGLAAVAWHALERGRAGLAWHLAHRTGAEPAPTALCALLATAPRADGSGVVDGLVGRQAVELWPAAEKLAFSDPVHLVGFLGALRVGLLAPASGASVLFADPKDAKKLPALTALAAAARDLAASGQALFVPTLAGQASAKVWEERISSLSQEAQRWLDRQDTAVLRCDRSTDIWRNWVGAERPVGRMIRIVIANRHADRGEAHDTNQSLETEFEPLLTRTDHALHGVRAARTPIEARSRSLLAERVEQARALVRRWEALLDAAAEPKAPIAEKLAKLRTAAVDGRAAVRAEIESLTDGQPTVRRAALAQFDDFVALLQGNPPASAVAVERMQELPLDATLNLELLLVPGLELDRDLVPTAGPDAAALEAAVDQSDWPSAFAARVERNDFPGASVCLDVLARLGHAGIGDLRETWQGGLTKARSGVEQRQVELLHQLIQAAATEQLSADEQLALEASIRSALPAPFVDIPAAERALGAASERLAQLAARAREEADRALDAGDFSGVPQSILKRIRALIRNNRLELAYDYMERLREGAEIPRNDELASVWGSAFPLFFGPFIDQANALHRARGSLASIRDAVSTAPRFLEPLETLGGDEPLRREALALLDAWELAKRRGDDEAAKGVQQLFELLKFRAPKLFKYLVPPRSAVTATLHLQCAIINDRNTVIIPSFSSAAQGHYRIVLLWGSLTAQQMASRIAESVSLEGGPIVVLCFRPLDRNERLSLARLAATSKDAPIMVLDEALLLFLAQFPSSGRLKAFFDCTLPFTAVDPYVPEGAPLPGEMFFGRQQESAAIVATDERGSVLVYGAPRLGKTALLKHIEAEHPIDLKDHKQLLVRHVDIRGLGRGQAPPRGITKLMTEQLKSAGVLMGTTETPAEFERKVKEWLDESGGGARRMLLLLDDADAFLRKDAEDSYPELNHLRQLMESTNRRFKFCLAGTQAAMHLAHDQHSPLAGLGGATLVGKLRRGADLRDAERLVRQPLETLGYCFPQREAVSLIIAHCDGDPGLIQAFCAGLLAATRRRFLAEPDGQLPFPITIEDVTNLASEPEPEAAVSARLHAALDLDGRYHYVSRLIALVCAGDERRGLIEGMPLADLHDQAMLDWPEGFGESTSVEEFRALLDEMVELDLLRRVAPEVYALRYPNLPLDEEDGEKLNEPAAPAGEAGASPRRRQERRALQEAGA
ncbi:MAG TPA: AAA family ATPase [Stellaceae bacterium]|nr:AAA family ATPase [Stellaceae bacterium]